MKPCLDKRSKRLLEFVNPGEKDNVLVIGTGVFPKVEYFLSGKVKNIVSVDFDKKNLENGEKILPEVEFKFLDAEKKFNFKDKEFDKVIFTEVLEHLNNENNALSEINRILKDKGKFILSVPKKRWFNLFSPITWIQHKREYKEVEIITKLKKNNFRVEQIFVGGSIYDLFNLWLHLIYKYFLGKLVDNFFEKKINKSWDKKTKGTDIMICARK